jgi:hypothetical protein
MDQAEFRPECASPKPPRSESADDIERWLVELGTNYRLCAESELRKVEALRIIYGEDE